VARPSRIDEKRRTVDGLVDRLAKLISPGVVLCAVVCTFADGLSAARPVRWPRGQVVGVWIDPIRRPPGAEAMVGRALKTWTEAAAGRVTLQVSPARDAAIRFHFTPTGEGLYGGTAPVADMRTGVMLRADIMVTTAPDYDPLSRSIVIYLTSLHELGHALGLDHTDDASTIMFRFKEPEDAPRYFAEYRTRIKSAEDIGSGGATGLSSADIQALAALYD
jgi:hypothetical protein